MTDIQHALELLAKYAQEHTPLRTRIVKWLRRLYRVLMLFWIFTTSSGDNLTITVPRDYRVSVTFVNDAREFIQFYPELVTEHGRDDVYTFTGLSDGVTYIVRLHDRIGSAELAYIVHRSGVAVDMQYVTMPDAWQMRAPVEV